MPEKPHAFVSDSVPLTDYFRDTKVCMSVNRKIRVFGTVSSSLTHEAPVQRRAGSGHWWCVYQRSMAVAVWASVVRDRLRERLLGANASF